MLRFTANLSLLFGEYPLIERFKVAKEHGFDAVEIQFPYQLPAEQIQDVLQTHNLKLVLFNVDADTLLQGGEGLAAVPEKQSQFKDAVALALEYAVLLKPEVINILPGRCLDAGRLTDYRQTFKNNLRYAADAFAEIGVTTVFEAVNRYDMPGFIIDSGSQMLTVLAELNHPSLRLQYDIYHMTRMQENCAAFLTEHLDKIGHIQFADCPGRSQPGTGNIDFSLLFGIINDSPYGGWVGAEYRPSGDTRDSLAWLRM
jgi:hydroxypyruvate isomerase